MSRESDLQWFLNSREELYKKFQNLWLVVKDGEIQKVLKSEEEAVEFSINEFGIEVASVFQATSKNPYVYIGGAI